MRSRPMRAESVTMADAVITRDGLRVVGQPVVRHDARDKVAAATAYAADWALPGMLHAAVLRSPHPSARIARLDTTRAAARARLAGAPAVHGTANLLAYWHIARGDVARALTDAAVVVEGDYTTQMVDAAYLEPESGVAWIDSDGVITIRLSTQVIEHFRDVAEVLQVPQNRVRVIGTYLGGGFGGKEDVTVEAYLGLLALKTGRPVKMVWTRHESLLSRAKRHP